MKRIVEILTNAFKPDIRVYKEAIYMQKLGYEVTILGWDREPEDDLPSEEDMNGIHVVRFRIVSAAGREKTTQKVISYLSYIKECKKYLKENDCMFLHCNDISGAVAGYLARNRKTPMVVDMHEFFESGSYLKRRLMHTLIVFIFKHSKAGLYENAAYIGDSYKSVRHKLYPLRNYPDSNMVKCVPKTQSNQFRIGFHGWIRPRMVEFKALFEAVKGMEDVRVDINGGGPGLPKISEIAKNYSNVYIHGPFDGTKALTGLYSETDLLFCGYDPNDPNYQGDAEIVKYYEAIRTGTPMIMVDGVGMSEKVRRFGFGVTCDTTKSDEIIIAIRKLKDDRDFWEECHNNELKESPKYCWEEAVKILEKVY